MTDVSKPEPSGVPATAASPKPAEISPLLLARALETVSEGSLITDAQRNTIYSNLAFTTITGYSPDEIVGTNCRFLQGPETSPETVQHIRDALDAGTVFQGTILNYRKDGERFWNHLTITPLLDDHGHVTHFVSVQRDVTDTIEERDRLTHAARHDPLTGLPNREGARRLLRQSLTSADERGGVVAVGLIDLDHFKAINDQHGHLGGDQVLIELGTRIKRVLRRHDHVARLGGDEFVLIVSDLDAERAAAQFADVARRIRAEIIRPMRLTDDAEASVTSSMGVAFYPSDGVDSRSLYAAADRALYRAKENRGADDWYRLATPETGAGVSGVAENQGDAERFTYEGAPAHHVEGSLVMYMQPIVDVRTGSVTQFEALARIRRPDGTVLMPDQFLPSYSTEGLHELFWIGIHQALEWVATWQQRGFELGVSVNVPPEILSRSGSAQLVVDALELNGVEPQRLSLELLETRLDGVSVSADAIDELVRLGVRLHLDDISSGYSTLKRVTELPFDVIKIDRHIFDNVHTRALHVITVLAAIIKLGDDFGYGVTVEGVETLERLDVSRVLGARYGQGFLFARPMPPEEVVEWLESFSLPASDDAVLTHLGALAYHWSRMRGEGAQHPPRDRCALTAFFDGADPQVVELHDRLHSDPEANADAATLLTSWLMDEVSGRH